MGDIWVRLRRLLLGSVLGALGVVVFHTRRSPAGRRAAGRVFRHLLACDRESFQAHFWLGRLAAAETRMHTAMEHFTTCCRLDVSRFRKTRLPEHLKDLILFRECLAHDLGLEWTRLGALWDREPGEVRPDGHERRRRPLRAESPVSVDRNQPAPARTDFSNRAEAEKFAGLPAISRYEVASVNWDELLGRL